MNFLKWKSIVDEILFSSYLLTSEELPDMLWNEYFTKGYSPEKAVKVAIDTGLWDTIDLEEFYI